tara:strand:+ start:45068 stop:45394 length:327 start_codon:yes stop_codon:yes gene_type:complete
MNSCIFRPLVLEKVKNPDLSLGLCVNPYAKLSTRHEYFFLQKNYYKYINNQGGYMSLSKIQSRRAIDAYLNESYSDNHLIDLPVGKKNKVLEKDFKTFSEILQEKVAL